MPQCLEIPIVLGTAGHIDHGKTTLVRVLTGVDCDRLGDEKRRGITIELGFAPLSLPSGRVVSIVDVPGHERFIRHMVAGAAGIDGVLFVISADEGVRAQTREHLDILGLIGVRHGLIALTKSDLVEKDYLELVVEEVRDEIRGTFIEGAEIIPVSSSTGFNLGGLLSAIDRLVDGIPFRDSEGPFFMPVDRVFPVKGFGSVVTGTAYRGKVRKDDTLVLLPRGLKADIRSVQIHDTPVNEGRSGQRIALSLGGVSLSEIERGEVLCTPGVFTPTVRMDIRLSILPASPDPVVHWQRVRIHIGTADVVGRVALLDREKANPGEDVFAQIVTEEPVVAVRGEPFIIRFYSPLMTIGGGSVLMPFAKRPRGHKGRIAHWNFLEKISRAGSSKERFSVLSSHLPVLPVKEAVMILQELPDTVNSLAADADGSGLAVFLDSGEGLVVASSLLDRKREEISSLLAGLHEEEPENPGMPADILCRKIFPEIEGRNAKKILERWVEKGLIIIEDQRVRLTGFVPTDASKVSASGSVILEFCSRRLFQLPAIDEISDGTGLSGEATARSVDALRAKGQMFLAGGEFLVSREVLDRFIDLIGKIEGDITVATARDTTGSSRKFVLPLLEMLDSMGITRRIQEKRIIRKK
ncbi:MAG: selenocysteine-specific translation elongation factor [Thermovirgaceae bacterium]|nr:selenocysteine-specific translation elongation factor [Thermovirgaceae bacterium]